jgi:CRP-like cAMP-binding protein
VAVERPEPGTFIALLSDDDRDALLALGGLRRFARGEHLMHEGEPGDRVLVLESGHVKASSTDPRGRETVLAIRGPGDILGELTFTNGASRSGDVIAMAPVEARALAASQFSAYLLQRPTAALTLIEAISRRVRDADNKRVQFGELDTVGRIAARLVELCERYGERSDGEIAIGLPITQADLAGWTGSSSGSVDGALRTMRELGWITTERRRITVTDLDALEQRTYAALHRDRQ